ncbi:MAG: NADH-quinone oxidoreductase subunit B family protein [Nitrososphaerales archaeon]
MMNLVKWARLRSPWLLHFNTGGCNGCDIEVLAALTPRYDLERFGVLLKGSPRHADVLVVTGPVTRQVKDRLLRVYNQVPDPKFVVAVGTCCISGGVFNGCYNVYPGLDSVIPVDAYVFGCPPKPEAIINGVAALLKKIEAS